VKLRLTESSVRVRCAKSEVDTFAAQPAVETVTVFPDGRALRLVLSAGDKEALAVSFDGATIEIAVPRAMAIGWAGTGDVGIYGRDGGLDILIEKDFRRTSRSSPDDADRYPNPNTK
jgi:hypothetical protein